MDGTVAAYRFPYLLAGDSLVLKQDSKYYEWFYKSLKTGVHFLGVKEDLSNLVAQVKWAMENDDQAKKIALNGQKFARNNLMPQDIFCYYAVLLQVITYQKSMMSLRNVYIPSKYFRNGPKGFLAPLKYSKIWNWFPKEKKKKRNATVTIFLINLRTNCNLYFCIYNN